MEEIKSGTYQVIGVPGSGKTTYLTHQVQRAMDTHGKRNVVVASFTKAAAAEIVGRDLDIQKDQVGTLHAMAYRAIDRPKIVEDRKGFKAWNEHIRGKKSFLVMSGDSEPDLDDLGSDHKPETEGERLLHLYGIMRNRMLPKEVWTPALIDFAKEWEAWKAEIGGIDFTDMIQIALRDVDRMPLRPEIGFLDEAQDCSRLQLALWNKWAKHMDYNILCGDSDQCIYGFAGVDVGAFLDLDIPESNKRYLTHSHRCPRTVASYANLVIQRCIKRDPCVMEPRDADGQISRNYGFLYKHPEYGIRTVLDRLSEGKSVAVLGTCSYMLANLLAVLRKEGVPFQNKYRRKRGDWNPLFHSSGTTTANRVASYFVGDRLWTLRELQEWAEMIQADETMIRGAKKEIAELESNPTLDQLKMWFAPSWPRIVFQDPEWFKDHLLSSHKKKAEFALKVMEKRGLDSLKKEPSLTVGTIHSVKGATFDVVYLFPDLSRQGYEQLLTDRDSVLRTWYVGVTRCREELVLCGPSSRMVVGL